MKTSLADRRIVIAGGSGFLGVSLAHYLASRGAEVIIISRNPPKVTGPWKHETWDARTPGSWGSALDGASGLVNLTGRSVNCIKSPSHVDEILRSRVESTTVLGRVLREVATPPPVWVQMSTAHIYGDPDTLRCTEESAFGYGLAPTVGRAWEEAFHASILPTQRGVILRTSFVLGNDRGAGSGALQTLKLLAKYGLGGRVGSGRQGISWIHETDLNRIIERALLNDSMSGPYIASSPHPVSQFEFMRTLRHALGIPIGLPASSWMVRLGAPLLLRTDANLALYGRYVIPARLEREGFTFQLPDLKSAIRDLLQQRPATPSPRLNESEV